jgi:putative FmdB family regulatory protein
MPIYEFKCLKCEEFFELLVMKNDEEVDMHCPKCNAAEFERVLSTTNYAMAEGGASASSPSANAQTRTCSGGSCTTYDLPGPSR